MDIFFVIKKTLVWILIHFVDPDLATAQIWIRIQKNVSIRIRIHWIRIQNTARRQVQYSRSRAGSATSYQKMRQTEWRSKHIRHREKISCPAAKIRPHRSRNTVALWYRQIFLRSVIRTVVYFSIPEWLSQESLADKINHLHVMKSNNAKTSLKQCCGSMTFWCGSGSGSGDPCLWLMDPDPAIFIIDLQDANKNKFI